MDYKYKSVTFRIIYTIFKGLNGTCYVTKMLSNMVLWHVTEKVPSSMF